MKLKKTFIVALILLTFFSFKVLAKTVKTEDKSELTVEADISLEWFEKEKYYLAKGNVILKKDGLTLRANIVRANYTLENGENVLKNLIAKKNVILTKGKSKAIGQFMNYDVSKKTLVISGPFQTFSSPSGYVESKKFIMFDDFKNKAEASGSVKIIMTNKNVIYADNIKADFTTKDKTLEKVIAKGNVIIENKYRDKKSKADIGIYNSSDEIIRLSGNVVIINQNSIINGSAGITNLKTGVSNIIGDSKNNRRVKGVFSPVKKLNNRN